MRWPQLPPTLQPPLQLLRVARTRRAPWLRTATIVAFSSYQRERQDMILPQRLALLQLLLAHRQGVAGDQGRELTHGSPKVLGRRLGS